MRLVLDREFARGRHLRLEARACTQGGALGRRAGQGALVAFAWRGGAPLDADNDGDPGLARAILGVVDARGLAAWKVFGDAGRETRLRLCPFLVPLPEVAAGQTALAGRVTPEPARRA